MILWGLLASSYVAFCLDVPKNLLEQGKQPRARKYTTWMSQQLVNGKCTTSDSAKEYEDLWRRGQKGKEKSQQQRRRWLTLAKTKKIKKKIKQTKLDSHGEASSQDLLRRVFCV